MYGATAATQRRAWVASLTAPRATGIIHCFSMHLPEARRAVLFRVVICLASRFVTDRPAIASGAARELRGRLRWKVTVGGSIDARGWDRPRSLFRGE
jgi:hypothetical protein